MWRTLLIIDADKCSFVYKTRVVEPVQHIRPFKFGRLTVRECGVSRDRSQRQALSNPLSS
jgi:hypothetical protein